MLWFCHVVKGFMAVFRSETAQVIVTADFIFLISAKRQSLTFSFSLWISYNIMTSLETMKYVIPISSQSSWWLQWDSWRLEYWPGADTTDTTIRALFLVNKLLPKLPQNIRKVFFVDCLYRRNRRTILLQHCIITSFPMEMICSAPFDQNKVGYFLREMYHMVSGI